MRQIISCLIGLLLSLCCCQDSPEVGALYEMHIRLTESANSYLTGYAPQTKLVRMSTGEYARRCIMLCPGYMDYNSIRLYWSDPPYTSWSDPITIITNSIKDYPFSVYLSAEGSLYIVWTRTDYVLCFKKAWFSDKTTVTTSSEVIICEHASNRNYYPTITRDSIKRLWVSWTYYDAGAERRFVHVKASVNDGGIWGTGPSDQGTCLTNGKTYTYSQITFQSPYICCVYSDGHMTLDGDNILYLRRHELQASGWADATVLRSGVVINHNFRAVLNQSGIMGLLYRAGSDLEYREFDGTSWGDTFIVRSGVSLSSIFLTFYIDAPYAFWTELIGYRQRRLLYSYKFGEAFVEPVAVTKSLEPFDYLYCYNYDVSPQYYDVTSSGADDTVADVYHIATGVLLQDAGAQPDAILLGMTEPFAQATVSLSTIGSDGELSWQYYGRGGWTEFTPENGVYNLDASYAFVHLWQDIASCPNDWIVSEVEGKAAYWVKAQVASTFTIAPVGTQLTVAGDIDYPQVLLEETGSQLICMLTYGVTRVLEDADLIMFFRGALSAAYTVAGFRSSTYLGLSPGEGQDPSIFYFDADYVVSSSGSESDDLLVRVSFDGGDHYTTLIHSSASIDLCRTVQTIPSGEWDDEKGMFVDVQVQSLASLRDIVPSAIVSSEYIRGDVGKPGVEIDIICSETGEKRLIVISQRDGTFSGLVPPGNYNLKFRGLPIGQEVSMIVAGQPIKTQRNLIGVTIGHSDKFGKFGKTAGEVSKQVEEADIKDTFSSIEWARYLVFDTFVDDSKKADLSPHANDLSVGEGKLYIGGTSIDWFFLVTDPSL